MSNVTLEGILSKRNEYPYGSVDWHNWNGEKANLLEKQKESLKERIVYFKECDLLFLGNESFIPVGDNNTLVEQIKYIQMHVQKRSLLEYVAEQRHPIPYVYIRDGERYFFISRESGSGETRLIGKKGMLGGHVGEEDIVENNLEATLRNGMLRELEEEAAITESNIKHIQLKGLIKSNVGVDSDHLGLVYEITLDDANIETQEEGVINGLWLTLDEVKECFDSFENWSKIVIENIFKI